MGGNQVWTGLQSLIPYFSRSPGEWWKVKHAAEPEAEAPVIWSDYDEEDPGDGQQVNSVSGQEPRNFKQAMQGSQSDRWRDAVCLSTTLW